MLCGVIMAGGKGTRFWPLSTEEKPKQFLRLVSENTMLQMTLKRIELIIPIERIFVCTCNKYKDLVKKQIPNLPEKNIIIEPESRNTAPSIALAAFIIKRYYKDATMVVLPSDHLINEEEKFRRILLDAEEYLEKNNEAIVTLGMLPNRPETGYGYIKFTDIEKHIGRNKIIKVEKFTEKPSLMLVEEYLKDGHYLWNGGMFIWKIDNILNQMKRYMLNTYTALENIENIEEQFLQQLIEENYSKTDSISIDYGILEKVDKIYVIPSNIGWDDIGTWKAMERYREKDIENNIISGNVEIIESKSNMAINNSTKKLIMIGMQDTMTLETEEAVYIVNKAYMDNLKEYRTVL